jgi:hypothetical protein
MGMSMKSRSDRLIWFLKERAKELNCLYKIEEILSLPHAELESICTKLIDAIPSGWQYSDVCRVAITIEDVTYSSPDFKESPWMLSEDIEVQNIAVGKICVYYTRDMPGSDTGPFLKEEKRLLSTIANRFGHFIMYRRMKQVFQNYRTDAKDLQEDTVEEWRSALNLLRQTDKNLFLNISRRMLNYLCWSGVDEAEQLFKKFGAGGDEDREAEWIGEDNRPHQKSILPFSEIYTGEIFRIAAKHLSNDQILASIHKWIQEDRLSFLIEAANRNLSLGEISNAIRRYHHMAPESIELPAASRRGVQASLIRCFLSEQPQFINVAKEVVEIKDFYEVLDHIVLSSESHGKLGGKSAGLFLAKQIIRKAEDSDGILENIKIPKTWYIPSDIIIHFLSYNDLNEVVQQKYKDINQVRIEYPHIVQMFKNSRFPPEVVQGLSMALDDFGENPLIVRSSSLLEDRIGAAFSGKYRSLFLANQGSKQERLDALMDAIAEVYASTFGPDPIEYRSERGLLDFNEEMGIMIQEVVGTRVGDYYFPSFGGVAFSRNEFRWSPRIHREDGLVRIVPGLGTRAVDRTSDDYPVLIAPGQRDLNVNVTVDEIVRYSPMKVDVIDLKANSFGTVDIQQLLKTSGNQIPGIEKIVSRYDGDHIHKPLSMMSLDFDKDDLIVTFEGLKTRTEFINQIQHLLTLLEEKLGTPIDIEFASDGEHLYLLQCRAQSYLEGGQPVPIPRDIPKDRIIFTANRYISNGSVPDITHIVYIDPEQYDRLSNRSSMVAVGRAVSAMNKLLPKHQFILMGPGRWGSRGDIKLGVRVTYSDINNTAVLIEIARKKGNWVPDLSFGTHFFQDLVEADIRYLPLYPDDKGSAFNEHFFRESENLLPETLPEYSRLAETVRLIDVPRVTGGCRLRILMNADLDEAVAYLVQSSSETTHPAICRSYVDKQTENYWAWRMKMAQHIAMQIDPVRFGVRGFYVFGSTKNATAGPDSDINVLIHFSGTDEQRRQLLLWLEGWSLCLDEMNFHKTGARLGGLLDVHIVTDEDIANKSSYALKIGAVTDAARSLPLRSDIQKSVRKNARSIKDEE